MRFDGFVLAVDTQPEPPRARSLWRRRPADGGDLDYGVRSGLAFSVLTAPRVNAPAWAALAVAAPLALIAVAVAATQTGLAQAAGVATAALLVPAIVLAARTLERRGYQRKATAPDPGLTRAFALTVGQSCGLLVVVMLGAPLSAQSVAVGLTMAAGPLALGLAAHAWRKVFRPLDARAEPPVEVGRDWLGEWAETERAQAPPEPEPPPEPVAAPVVPFPAPARVPVDEAEWVAPPRRRAGGRR